MLAAALLVVAVAAGTIVLVDNNADGPAVGTPLPAAQSEIAGTEVRFELPTGGITFTVAEPVEEVAPDSRVPNDREAHGGTSLLGIGWSANLGALGTLGETAPDESIVASAALLVTGERIDLGELWDLGVRPPPTEGFLVVPGEADQLSVDDLVLEVGYDGLVQSVNIGSGEGDRGVAEQYGSSGQLPSTRAVEACGEVADRPETPGLATIESCNLERIVLTPYLRSLGWTEPNTTWALVTVSVFVYIDYQLGADPGEGTVLYELTSATQEATLGGEPRAAELERSIQDGNTVLSTMAFQLPADQPPGELVISGIYEASTDNEAGYPESSGFPPTVSVPLDVVLTLPELS